MALCEPVDVLWNTYASGTARLTGLFIAIVALVALLGVVAFPGGVAAHADGDGLTVHNQTRPLDRHGEVHTITIDKATADTDFYVDVHTEQGTINTTRTFPAGTVRENLVVSLDPTITEDTVVTVATHAANGTELANSTVTITVVEAPTVSFSDQVRALDRHGEVHAIEVDTVAANQGYYVDAHTANGTINTTGTFEGGTARTDLELTLDPTLKSTTNVTVAVHATNGTELAAQTATVTTAGVQFWNQTHELDEHGEVHSIDVAKVSAGKRYYVDAHTEEGTINTTGTFEAGTVLENLELELDPTLTEDTEVTVAVHDEDGTELAATTALVTVTGGGQTVTATSTTDVDGPSPTDSPVEETATPEPSGETVPGFGILAVLVGLIGAMLIGHRFQRPD